MYNLNSDKKIKSMRRISMEYLSIDRRQLFNDVYNNKKEAIRFLDEIINGYFEGICRIYDNTKIQNFCLGGGISEYKDIFTNKLIDLFKESSSYNCINVYNSKYCNDTAIIGATLLPDNYKRISII